MNVHHPSVLGVALIPKKVLKSVLNFKGKVQFFLHIVQVNIITHVVHIPL